ncbi:hypothetical protein GQ54DRAFT_296585 [Martensiomyces pterosporus]|nr:hypothetical protein GQ54DRAFT_296585 [Martensiomyces pterosporus]
MAIPTRSRASSAANNSSNNSNSNDNDNSSSNTTVASEWLSRQSSWSSNDEAVSDENMAPVLDSFLNDQDTAEGSVGASQIVTTAKVFKQLADMSRSPQIRHTLTNSRLPQASCILLQRTVTDLSSQTNAGESNGEGDERAEHVFLLVQLLRCICNLSADNDAGRAKILEFGGVSSLAKVLGSVAEVWMQPMPVGQAAFGAALNVSLNNEACTKALISAGALLPHLKALRPENASNAAYEIWPLICMSLDNMCEDEMAKSQFEAHTDYALTVLRSLAKFSRMLADDSHQGSVDAGTGAIKAAQRTLLWILCEMLEKSAKVRRQLCQPESVLAFFDILEFYLAKGPAVIEEDDDDDDDDDDQEGDTGALTPPSHAEAAAPAPLPPNKPIPQTTNRFADAVTQVVVAISGEDDALEALFENQQLINRLLTILTTDRGTSDDSRSQRLDGMAAAAALCLGNLARTDEHCTRLVAEHPALVRTLIHEWFSSRAANVRTRHAASGLLKNLCLPPANKQKMVGFGLVAVAAQSIDTAVVPVQANAIGILRHLSNGAPAAETVLQLVERPTGRKACALADLLQVVKGTDVDAIRCEGTRLVANIIKRVYLQREQGVVRSADARKMLERAGEILDSEAFDLVTPLIRLIILDGQKHPLLQQESLIALTILASTNREKSRHVGDMVRLLSPASASAFALPVGTSEDSASAVGDSMQEEGESSVKASRGFAEVLESLLVQDGKTWPQSVLQAKSLVGQLAVNSAGGDGLDSDGIAALQSRLVSLAGTPATPTKRL